MKKLMNYLFLSCRKATILVEKKILIGLKPKEKIQLIMHTSMCDACKKYSHQSTELDKLIKNHVESFTPENNSLDLNNTSKLKDKIISSLKD